MARKPIQERITPELLEAGRRAADIINAKLLEYGHESLANRCMAIRLSDGDSDGVIYDSKRDAIRHQLHERQCWYVFFRNIPSGAQAREVAIMLLFQREAYDAGVNIIDPDNQFGGPEPLMTTNWMDSLRRAIHVKGIR